MFLVWNSYFIKRENFGTCNQSFDQIFNRQSAEMPLILVWHIYILLCQTLDYGQQFDHHGSNLHILLWFHIVQKIHTNNVGKKLLIANWNDTSTRETPACSEQTSYQQKATRKSSKQTSQTLKQQNFQTQSTFYRIIKYWYPLVLIGLHI